MDKEKKMKAKKELEIIEKQKQIDDFNNQCPVGSDVIVTKDNGDLHYGQVKYPASFLSGDIPVGWVTGIAGCYLLNRIKKSDRKICREGSPYLDGQGKAIHPDAIEIEVENNWPGGDIITYQCPNCGEIFKNELEQ